MADEYAPPSVDPANEDSLTGLLRQVMGKFLQGVDDMMPATVLAYDRVTNRATVRPQVMMVATDGSQVGRAQIASVPVFQFGGGGFLMSFPIQPGDLGWIKASDRDVSLFFQNEPSEAPPNTTRMHSFEDGLFFPDAMRQWTLAGEDAERAVWQSTDGTTRVAIGDGIVKVTAALMEVDGDLLVTGSITDGAGIVLGTHTHSGVDPGGGTSGPPTP